MQIVAELIGAGVLVWLVIMGVQYLAKHVKWKK